MHMVGRIFVEGLVPHEKVFYRLFPQTGCVAGVENLGEKTAKRMQLPSFVDELGEENENLF